MILAYKAISATDKAPKLIILLNHIIAIHIGPTSPTSGYGFNILLHDHSMLILECQEGRKTEPKWQRACLHSLQVGREMLHSPLETYRICLLVRLVLGVQGFPGLFCRGGGASEYFGTGSLCGGTWVCLGRLRVE